MGHDLHNLDRISLAGPSDAEQTEEVRARHRRYQKEQVTHLVRRARAHQIMAFIQRKAGKEGRAKDERIMRDDALARARNIKGRMDP